MNEIEILGKKHQVVIDGFGLVKVDGVPLNEFLDSLSPEENRFLYKIGLKTAQEEPEYVRDMGERYEMDKDHVERMIKLAKEIQ